jgi:hypothetical protein
MSEPKKRPRKKPVAKRPPKSVGFKATKNESKIDPKIVLAEVEAEIVNLSTLRGQKTLIEDQIKDSQTRVVKAFQVAGTKSHKFVGPDGSVYSASFQQTEKVTLDEAKLKKRLGSALWNQITTKVLDRKKLDAAVAAGDIKPTDLSACSNVSLSAPFTKVTKK